jgi:hypothetical protein
MKIAITIVALAFMVIGAVECIAFWLNKRRENKAFWKRMDDIAKRKNGKN